MKYLYLILGLSLPLYLWRFNVGAPTTALEIFTWLMLLIILYSRRKELSTALIKIDRQIIYGVILMIIGSVIGLTISTDRIDTLGLFKGFLITPMAAGLIVLASLPEERKLLRQGIYASAVIAGGYAFYQFIAGQTLADGRIAGHFVWDANASPNYLSLFIAPIGVMALFDLFNSTKTKWPLFEVLVLTSSIVGILASQSRAGLALIIIALAYFVWQLLRKSKYQKAIDILVGGLAGVAVISILILARPDLSASPNEGRTATSNNIRFEIWKTTFEKIMPAFPLTGVGFGQYQKVFTNLTQGQVNYPEYISPLALTPHNVFLSAWANLGLVGLAGFVLVIWAGLKSSGKNNAWYFGLISILLLGLFDTAVFKNDLGAMFWMTITALQTSRKNK